MKKYFVFSDIHGNLMPLVEALEVAGFDLENQDHILLSLGDHFDRGVENLKVLGFLKYFWRKKRLIMIRGNHDDFLLNFLKGKDNGVFNIRYNGFGNTLIEFADKEANTTEKIRESILKRFPFLIPLLESMVETFSLGNYLFLHAGYTYDETRGWYLYNFSRTLLFVQNFDPHEKTYVFGHFHTHVLNKYFKGIESDGVFHIKGFIGIDGRTVITKKVNILVFNEEGILETKLT